MEKNSSARNESRYNLALRFARMWSDIKTRDGSAAWARMDVRYRCDLLQSLESRASSSNRGSRISTTSSHPRRTYYYAKSSSTVLDYYLKIVWPTVDAVVSAELCRPKWLSVAFPFEMPVGWLIAGRGTCLNICLKLHILHCHFFAFFIIWTWYVLHEEQRKIFISCGIILEFIEILVRKTLFNIKTITF